MLRRCRRVVQFLPVRVGFVFVTAASPLILLMGFWAPSHRSFALILLATLLGLFAARVLQVSDLAVQMVIASLVVGYAAGVAAGVSLRPWISIPAVLLAVIPTAASAAASGDVAHAVLALVLTALLAGGIGSMITRYLLRQVADRLRSLCRDGDVVARIGGDEFALLQTGIGHHDAAELMARRIVRALAEPYSIDGRPVVIGVSLGYAVPDTCGRDLQRLLACADRALYRIKREGGGAAAHAQAEDVGLAATA